MKITQDAVERVARLARLTLADGEKEHMAAQLEDILDSMAALDGLDPQTEGPAEERVNVLREDEPGQSFRMELLLRAAPRTDGAYILVPDAVGGREQ